MWNQQRDEGNQATINFAECGSEKLTTTKDKSSRWSEQHFDFDHVHAKLISQTTIDRMQKWLPINYSFIFVLISLTSLVSMRKIQKNFHTKMRLISLISIHIKE